MNLTAVHAIVEIFQLINQLSPFNDSKTREESCGAVKLDHDMSYMTDTCTEA